jgi:hypothetical protein
MRLKNTKIEFWNAEMDAKHQVRDFLISLDGGTELDLLMGENLRTLGRDLTNPKAQISQVIHRDQLFSSHLLHMNNTVINGGGSHVVHTQRQ